MVNSDKTIQTNENDTAEERIRALERKNQGILDDLISERKTRQELEARLGQIETSLTDAAVEPDTDPNARVNRLAADPDGYIDQRLSQALGPVVQEIHQIKLDEKFDRAYRWLGKQEGKDADEIRGSELEADVAKIVREHGMSNMDPVEGTKAAYKILQQDRREREKRESDREAAIDGNSTEKTHVGSRSSGPAQFTRDQISRMSPEEFNANYVAIKQAEKEGKIK